MATTAENLIFPAIEPYASGKIKASELHNIYYEECGNPAGAPVIVLHGGPGSGCTPGQRRFFDPTFYRVILFDQRGSGRSEPAGYIEENTTQHLVADIDLLRRHLNIDEWLVFGGSWGSTLALAYAATYPEQTKGLILRGIFLGRPSEIDWFLNQVRYFFPEAWEQFVSILDVEERADILAAYARRIYGTNEARRIAAARAWNAFEAAIMTLLPAEPSPPAPEAAILARARVQLHYLINGCFLLQTPLLMQIDKFRHIPAVIVQGRYDMVCPPCTAFELNQAWPEARFRIIPDAGHAAFETSTATALLELTEDFKRLFARHD